MSANSNQKVLVLIDSSNLFHALTALGSKEHPYRINYKLLLDLFEKEIGPVVKKECFSAVPPGKVRDDRAKYMRCLKALGLDVRSVPLKVKTHKCKQCGTAFETFVERGADLLLATEALRYGYQGLCTAVVIVSGSGVYLPVVEALQGAGIYVVIAAFKGHCTVSEDLWVKADKAMDLSVLAGELQLTFDTPKDADVTQSKSPYDTTG
jgi:hypothetical protein